VSGAQTSTRYRPAATSWSTRKRSPGASIPSSFVTSSTGAAAVAAAAAAAVESMRAGTASTARDGDASVSVFQGDASVSVGGHARLPFPFMGLCRTGAGWGFWLGRCLRFGGLVQKKFANILRHIEIYSICIKY